MKPTINKIQCEKMGGLVLVAAMLWMVGGCSDSAPAPANAPAVKTPAKAAASTNQIVQANLDPWGTNAVFENNPTTRRDPFYPVLASRASEKVAGAVSKPRAESVLVLKSILGTGSRRFAGINDRTFAVGETAKVRMPSGDLVRVCCKEISDTSVVVTVEGETEPKVLKLIQ